MASFRPADTGVLPHVPRFLRFCLVTAAQAPAQLTGAALASGPIKHSSVVGISHVAKLAEAVMSCNPRYANYTESVNPQFTFDQYYILVPYVQRKHRRILAKIYSRPTNGSIAWEDIEALFRALGGEVSEREGSRVAVVLFGEVRVFHRPHPSPATDKGAVASIRKWLGENGIHP